MAPRPRHMAPRPRRIERDEVLVIVQTLLLETSRAVPRAAADLRLRRRRCQSPAATVSPSSGGCLHRAALGAVDGDARARDPACALRGEEGHDLGDLFGSAKALPGK